MSHRFVSNRSPFVATSPTRVDRALLITASLALFATNGFSEAAPEATLAAAKRNEEVVHLDKVQVTASRDDELVTLAAATEKIAEIPGTASIVNVADVQRGRASNAEDLLSYQPGVFAQATSGNSANKISIRGSGLNTFYQGYSLGTKYLYDGQPITGPGGTQEELLAVASPSFIEILNGPNAFTYASTSLGGAINFVTHSGKTAPGFRARFEGGSFGYLRGELSYGGVSGKLDYYAFVSQNERDGFQINTPNDGNAAVVNLGYQFNERLDTRLILRFQREELYNGSTLTKKQIEDDPSQNNTIGFAQPTHPDPLKRAAQSARKKQGTTVVASKTSYTFADESKFELGLSNTNYPLENGWLFSNTPQDWRSNDFNVTLRYLRDDDLFGLNSKTTAIFSNTYLTFGDVHGYSRNAAAGTTRVLTQYTEFTGSRDTVLAVSNELEIAENTFWLLAGLSYAEIGRDVRITYTTQNTANPLGFPKAVDYVDTYFLPRAGFRYKFAPDLQLFGSVSQAVDGPVTWQLGSTGSSFIRPLKPQEATTVEVGVRGKWTIFDGSITAYRAWLDNELLTIRISNDPTVQPVNANASPTIHQGIEAVLTAALWESSRGDLLSLRQSYTLNDFYFENDPEWHDNELPSLPRQAYQAELLYQHNQGFYAGVNVRAASGYYIDFANTVEGDSYAILGARIGYETDRWQVFIDLRNLTDEHYATAANTVFNAGGIEATAQNFYPGDEFNVIGGISFRF